MCMLRCDVLVKGNRLRTKKVADRSPPFYKDGPDLAKDCRTRV